MTPAGALESLRFEDSSTTLPDTFSAQNSQVVLANRGKGRQGKPRKRQSRPRFRSNQLTSGTFMKNRGLQAIPNPNNAQGGFQLPAKKFNPMSRHTDLGKTWKVPAVCGKSRRFALPADP